MILPLATSLSLATLEFEPWRFLYAMDGPHFLMLYLVWFLVLWVGVLVLRSKNFDSPLTTVGGLALYEGLGVARYLLGSAHGLQKWDYLIAMMGFGFFFFVLRGHHFEQGGSSGGCGGGGCGGGGCGGGGCGGCGG
jgi:hypothetical protein